MLSLRTMAVLQSAQRTQREPNEELCLLERSVILFVKTRLAVNFVALNAGIGRSGCDLRHFCSQS